MCFIKIYINVIFILQAFKIGRYIKYFSRNCNVIILQYNIKLGYLLEHDMFEILLVFVIVYY